MNPVAPPTPPRRQDRWLLLVGMIFLIQFALIWFMGERWQPVPTPRPHPPVGLVPTPVSDIQISTHLFTALPNLFPGPSPHGFSGSAWLHGPTQVYTTPEPREPDHWLNLSNQSLATTLPKIAPKSSSVPFELADQNDPQVELSAINLPPEPIRTNSLLQVSGPLATRLLEMPKDLPAWPSAQPIKNSEIQIAVNGAGDVISARLLSRSGLPSADDFALNQARNLRFRPERGVFRAPVWTKINFEWMIQPLTEGAAPVP